MDPPRVQPLEPAPSATRSDPGRPANYGTSSPLSIQVRELRDGRIPWVATVDRHASPLGFTTDGTFLVFAGSSSELIVLDRRVGAVYELPVDADWIVAANTKRVLSGQTKDP